MNVSAFLVATGQLQRAMAFLGTARASSFRGAVDIIRDKSETPDLYTFKGARCFLWGCELFDNEADARRRFG